MPTASRRPRCPRRPRHGARARGRDPGAPGASLDPRWNVPATVPGTRPLSPGPVRSAGHCCGGPRAPSPQPVGRAAEAVGGWGCEGRSRSSPLPGTAGNCGLQGVGPRPRTIADRPVASLGASRGRRPPWRAGARPRAGGPESLLGPGRTQLVLPGFGPLGGNTISQSLVSVEGGREGARPPPFTRGTQVGQAAARAGSSLGVAGAHGT